MSLDSCPATAAAQPLLRLHFTSPLINPTGYSPSPTQHWEKRGSGKDNRMGFYVPGSFANKCLENLLFYLFYCFWYLSSCFCSPVLSTYPPAFTGWKPLQDWGHSALWGRWWQGPSKYQSSCLDVVAFLFSPAPAECDKNTTVTEFSRNHVCVCIYAFMSSKGDQDIALEGANEAFLMSCFLCGD